MRDKTPEKIMRKKPRHTPIPLILIILLLAGCAPVISKTTQRQVDRSLTFEEILKNPSTHRGAGALLGGQVIGVTNSEKISLVEVLQFPLSRRMKPRPYKDSKGRFLISVKGFLDPLVYRGKLVTAAGPLGAPVTRDLGKARYTYPLIKSRELHLWRFGADKRSPVSIGIGLGISGGY